MRPTGGGTVDLPREEIPSPEERKEKKLIFTVRHTIERKNIYNSLECERHDGNEENASSGARDRNGKKEREEQRDERWKTERIRSRRRRRTERSRRYVKGGSMRFPRDGRGRKN